MLSRLAGRYTMGPIEVTISKRDGGLRAGLPTMGTVALEPTGGSAFRVPGASGLSISFELAADGSVQQLVVHPLGLFQPVESPA
jgi:hypothetical protein